MRTPLVQNTLLACILICLCMLLLVGPRQRCPRQHDPDLAEAKTTDHAKTTDRPNALKAGITRLQDVATEEENSFLTEKAFREAASALDANLQQKGLVVDEGYSAQVPAQVRMYARLFRHARTVAETGFNAGHSALLMLVANPDLKVVSFDMGSHEYAHASHAYLRDRYPGRLEVFWGDSRASVPEFHAQNPDRRFDIVIVDGGHTYDVAEADIRNMRALAACDAVLIVDDTPCAAHYCVDPVITDMERAGVIQGLHKVSGGDGRGFSLFKYVDNCR